MALGSFITFDHLRRRVDSDASALFPNIDSIGHCHRFALNDVPEIEAHDKIKVAHRREGMSIPSVKCLAGITPSAT
jgi:hypothetical protein